MAPVSSKPMIGEAKQIVFFDERKKIKLNKKELENILNQKDVKDLPIVILSVIGAYRTGKSFLLSWLVRYFKSDVKTSEWIKKYEKDESLSQFFKWKSGPNPETQGIWAWSEVFVINGPSGEKFGVLLIDTQGLFDQNNTSKQNANIFTLSTLISSIQIFNLSQRIQEDSLANLQLFSEFGRLALAKKQPNSITPFQRNVFLIRDWTNPKTHPLGPQGGKDYINNYFKISREDEGTELGERRRQINQLFSKLDCYLMPKPGEKIETDESDSNSRLSDMNQSFKDHLGELPTFLFPNGAVEQPKLVAGTPVLAGDLASYVEYYVNLLNSADELSPQDLFKAMAKIHNNAVARDAKKEYKNFVTSVEAKTKTFLTNGEIRMKHLEAEKKALDYFEKQQMGDSNSGILNELKKDIKDEFEHWKSRNERAKAEVVNAKKIQHIESYYSRKTDRLEDQIKLLQEEARNKAEALAKQNRAEEEARRNRNMLVSMGVCAAGIGTAIVAIPLEAAGLAVVGAVGLSIGMVSTLVNASQDQEKPPDAVSDEGICEHKEMTK